MDVCWGIHAGKTGDADSLFLEKKSPCIAIGWDAMGNLSNIENDREAFKKKLVEAYPDTKKGAINTVAGMPFRFKYEMQIGDCKQSSKVHTFSPANAHFFSASFLAGNGLVVS